MTRYDSKYYNKPRKPICSGIWYYYCSLCCKKYIISGSHKKCYTCWDPICMEIFPTQEEYIEHAKRWHKDLYCETCQLIINLPGRYKIVHDKTKAQRIKETMKNHRKQFHNEDIKDKTLFC